MSESTHNSPEHDTSSFQGVRDALELAFYGTDFEETDDEMSLPFSYDSTREVVKTRTRTRSNFDSVRGTRVHALQVSCDLRTDDDRELQNMLFMTWEDGYVILVDLDVEALAEFVPLDDQDSEPSKDELTRSVIGGLSAVTSILD